MSSISVTRGVPSTEEGNWALYRRMAWRLLVVLIREPRTDETGGAR